MRYNKDLTDGEHWFDRLNKALVRPAPRRASLRAAAAAATSLALGLAPGIEAAKHRKKQGKGKGKGKGNGKGNGGKGKGKGNGKHKGQLGPVQICSGGACATTWSGDQEQIDYCEFICQQCDGDDPRDFCIIGGTLTYPDHIAVCCFEWQTCCPAIFASGQVCVDTSNDPHHCGDCDNSCPPELDCVNGQCSCPDGKTDCGGECAELQFDNRHCGNCGVACANGEHCYLGRCVPERDLCGPPLRYCNERCVDTRDNIAHCGTCGNACNKGALRYCNQGQCGCNPSTNDVPCNTACIPPGYKCCEGFGGYGCSNPNAICRDDGGCGAP